MAETKQKKLDPTMTEKTVAKTPHDLICKQGVETCLKNDKGSSATLKSYEIVDFTRKGDNYACLVSSVVVQYKTEDDKDSEVTYVVKLNPCRPSEFDAMTSAMFRKEIGFYTQILPLLNKELERLDERQLRIPNYYHSIETDKQQVIFLEDLRKSGFRMFDRMIGMDKEHTEMILRELARLHASSQILMSRGEFMGVDFLERFPVLIETFDAFDEGSTGMKMEDVFPSILQNGMNIASSIKGYERVSEFLQTKIKCVYQLFKEQIKPTAQFSVICHGDSWNNNFLFKYSPEGVVEECRMLDLQITRVGSPALDLNYMLFCSLNGDVRRKELASFFSQYYAAFSSVVAGAGMAMKFTLPQLKKEFYNKNLFGLINALMLIPLVLMSSEDAPDFAEMVGDDVEKSIADFQKLVLEQVKKNPLLKPRFLDLFDDMIESGVIP